MKKQHTRAIQISSLQLDLGVSVIVSNPFQVKMAPKDSNTVTVTAESDKKKEDDSKKNKKAEEGDESNLSEEDKELKERLETCVSTVLNEENEASVTIPIRLTALDVIVTELRTATSSMTSVPKPLKFLRPHFQTIKSLYKTMEKSEDLDNGSLELRARLADVLSVLAMTLGKPGKFRKNGIVDMKSLFNTDTFRGYFIVNRGAREFKVQACWSEGL